MFIHEAHNNLWDNKADFLIVKIKRLVMVLEFNDFRPLGPS